MLNSNCCLLCINLYVAVLHHTASIFGVIYNGRRTLTLRIRYCFTFTCDALDVDFNELKQYHLSFSILLLILFSFQTYTTDKSHTHQTENTKITSTLYIRIYIYLKKNHGDRTMWCISLVENHVLCHDCSCCHSRCILSLNIQL